MATQLSRREALTAFGAVSLGALLAACGGNDTPVDVPTTEGTTATIEPQSPLPSSITDLFEDAASCTLTPEETEGPYYFDVNSIRSDIREDREGATLRLAVRVRAAVACTPLPNAVVDIWHCDALGTYSGFESASMGGGGSGGRTDDETYLRGAQVTNSDGIVQFMTIYPGWYRGRTTHIHAKVHLDNAAVLTTQFYFADDFTASVYTRDPYSSDAGRDTFNTNDNIFDDRLLLTLSEDGQGYLGLITLDVASA